jgi:hypothetical protein
MGLEAFALFLNAGSNSLRVLDTSARGKSGLSNARDAGKDEGGFVSKNATVNIRIGDALCRQTAIIRHV